MGDKDADVVNLRIARADREQNNRLVTPLEVLERAASDLRDGTDSYNKLLIIALDQDDDGKYGIMAYRSNLTNSEAVALMEAMKLRMTRVLAGFSDEV